VLTLRLGEEHHEEGDQPLKTLGPLIEFTFDTDAVLNHHFEVLTVGHESKFAGFILALIRIPDFPDLS
jgi:hypothetical protein